MHFGIIIERSAHHVKANLRVPSASTQHHLCCGINLKEEKVLVVRLLAICSEFSYGSK